MKMNKLMSLGGIAGIAGLVGLVGLAATSGCSKDADPADEGPTSTVNMALSGADFSGNSVSITATRAGLADGKYPCSSGPITTCFNFDAAGHPIDPVSGANGFVDLCPTEDVNGAGGSGGIAGDWTFTYTIYSQQNCVGTVLSAPGVSNSNNFVCYDINDLFTQLHPNETFEESLAPGSQENTNHLRVAGCQQDVRLQRLQRAHPCPEPPPRLRVHRYRPRRLPLHAVRHRSPRAPGSLRVHPRVHHRLQRKPPLIGARDATTGPARSVA